LGGFQELILQTAQLAAAMGAWRRNLRQQAAARV
jgi:hypothetical protein